MKTGILGVDFAEGVRSAVCTWMEGKEGVNEKLCDAVLFSTLDANFMSKETTASGRSVHAVTTLPLLSLTESISFLGNGIEATFVDGQGMPITNRDTVVRQLALASGGHPRSMEYIIKYCNYQTELVETPKLKEVIVYVAAALCRMYNQDNCVQLLHDVLLGKMVNGDDLLVSGNSRSESYRSPVMRGVLIDSFMVENPVLFLLSPNCTCTGG